MNCKRCITVHMLQHPELIFWLKCPTCGYCELDSEAKSKHPKANKLTTYAQLFGQHPAHPQEDTLEEQHSPTSSHKE